jgi:hypothetical protein
MKKKPKKTEAVRIEPRKQFDRALIGKLPNGTLIYSFHELIVILREINTDWTFDDAKDWIDYNIAGLPLVINYYK